LSILGALSQVRASVVAELLRIGTKSKHIKKALRFATPKNLTLHSGSSKPRSLRHLQLCVEVSGLWLLVLATSLLVGSLSIHLALLNLWPALNWLLDSMPFLPLRCMQGGIFDENNLVCF